MKRLWYRLFEAWIAEVRRETRKRALDELLALSRGERIEAGIGSDVEAVYWRLIMAETRRQR